MARNLAQHAAEEKVRYHSRTLAQRTRVAHVNALAAAKRIRENRDYIRSFPCAHCGSTARTEWHHPKEDGTIKNRLAYLCHRSRSYIDAMIKPCIPLCLKCHRLEHAHMRRRAGIFPKRIRLENESRLCL